MSRAADAIAALMELHPKGYDLSLDRVRDLLARLGDPQDKLPPVIHVAGTNGKGSTIAFTRAILEAAGLRVHVHTSPHLVNWHERYRLAGHLVSDDVLADAIDRVAEANGGQAITVFEILTAVMFVLFSENDGDVALVEVGLGGRFDATNVMAETALSVITPIALDHTAWLGDTLAKIAFEKVGILRSGTPVIVGRQDEEAGDVIDRQAQKMRARRTAFGEDFSVAEENGRLVWQGEDRLLDLSLPSLPGDHQVTNAATAIAASIAFCQGQGHALTDEQIDTGLRSAVWPARLQRLTSGRLVDRVTDADIWIDGGHNPAAGLAMATHLDALADRDPRPTVFITGMLDTKDNAGFLGHFAGRVDRAVVVPLESSDAGVPPSELAAILKNAGVETATATTVEDAVATVTEERARVFIAGSLYLAGDALAANGTPPV